MALDKTIFKDKTLSDLLEEIHNNSSSTRNQVSSLIGELKPLIENIGDATLVVPMIKEYMEIGVKNDEHLIKMAAIIQRIESAANKGDGADFFDPSELADLLEASELTEVEDKAKPEEEENNE
jgi:hypothetical protein|tara:strand:- start:704 stop:1072 length:369 start_codon:yes stop_codon:yes gene_type:complete